MIEKILFIFAVLYPFMIYPWGINPYYTLPKSEYLMYTTIILWLIFVANLLRRKHGIKRLTINEWVMIVFLSLISISTIFSTNIQLSLYGEWQRFEGISALFSYVSLFFFSYRWIRKTQIDKLLHYIIYSSFLVSIYGILQHFLIDFLPRNAWKLKWTRSYAFFDNPNFFGSYLVIVLGISITIYLIVASKKQASFILLITATHFLALLYSLTRSGWLGLFFIVIFFTIYIFTKYKQLRIRWTLLLISFLFIFLVSNLAENNYIFMRAGTIVDDAETILQGDGHAGSSRFYIWKTALPLVKDYFWIGSGPDTFAVVFPKNPDELQTYFGNPTIKVDKAHNEYLQMAITLGVPALLVYLAFLYRLISSAIGLIRRKAIDPKGELLIFGLLLTIGGYLVQAFFNISVITVAPFFWIVLGLLNSKINDYSET